MAGTGILGFTKDNITKDSVTKDFKVPMIIGIRYKRLT